uniref:Copper transport protein n=1 Tax=Syphacia muris TaxID=451379 RepID=A0A0N5B0B4_9BILA
MNSTATKMRPMMEMYFHYRLEEYILFKEWLPTTTTAIAFCFEYEFYQFFLHKTCASTVIGCSVRCRNVRRHKNKNLFNKVLSFRRKYTTRVHWLQTVLYFMHSFGIYTLMLVTMTYNIPLLICVIIGRAATFFVLRPLTPAQKGHDVCECCG